MIIIRKDTVWGPGEAFLYDDVQVAAGVTLTIKSGAEIHGNGFKIEAYGKVIAVADESNPILFDNVKLGLSQNIDIKGSLEIANAQVSGGSINGAGSGVWGNLNITNSVINNISDWIYVGGYDSGISKINNNIIVDSEGVRGSNVDVGYNIFDRYGSFENEYGYQSTGYAFYSNGSGSDIQISHHNAFLDAGAETLILASYASMDSSYDYFGTRNKDAIQSMLRDNSDDLSIENKINLTSPASLPSSSLKKSIFSFVSFDLPNDIVLDLRLLGKENIDAKGNKLSNKIIGNTGNNTIDGGLGADTMIGGAGNDTYIVDNVRDVILENSGKGYDSVVASVSYTLAANVERLTLSGTKAINATGNALANHLVGNGAANVLDGKGGADLMEGGAGNDVYFVDHVSDRVIEAIGEGRDTVVTTVSYRLAAEQQIEILQTADANGKAALKLTGNEFGNKLIGNAGDNVLDGGAGIDEMRGGAGNDTYVVDHARDVVVEAVGGGTDTVLSFVSYALKAGQEIETLRLTSKAGSVNLTGNEFGQTLVGTIGVNVLDGGLGADVMTGGKGADTFVFATALGAGNVDRITDFSAVDTIRLSKSIFSALAPGELKAEEFKDVAKGKVDADDHILYDSRDGSLFYDADGSGKAAAVKFAVLDNKAALTHADVLIA